MKKQYHVLRKFFQNFHLMTQKPRKEDFKELKSKQSMFELSRACALGVRRSLFRKSATIHPPPPPPYNQTLIAKHAWSLDHRIDFDNSSALTKAQLFVLEKHWRLGTPVLPSKLTIIVSRFQTSVVFFS